MMFQYNQVRFGNTDSIGERRYDEHASHGRHASSFVMLMRLFACEANRRRSNYEYPRRTLTVRLEQP